MQRRDAETTCDATVTAASPPSGAMAVAVADIIPLDVVVALEDASVTGIAVDGETMAWTMGLSSSRATATAEASEPRP